MVEGTPAEQSRPRRGRGRPRALDEQRIVDVALRLAAGGRFEQVSMRTLAQELDVPVMTLYTYVPNKAALGQLVLDQMLRQVRVPEPDEGPWEQRLLELQRNARRVLGRHGVMSLSRYGAGGGEAARLAEGVLSILRSGGFSDEEAARAFTALYTFMIGQIEVDGVDGLLGGRVEQALEDVGPTTSMSRDALFEFGLTSLIEGLKRQRAAD
jgi:AcrR family transcriptional regulator